MSFDKETMMGGALGRAAAEPQAQLVCVSGNCSTVTIVAEIHLGRHSGNDCVLTSDRASRRHATVVSERPNYFLSDLGSRNGTLLNGRVVREGERVQLHHKDLIEIADYRFVFVDWSGLAEKFGLETIHLDSERVRAEAAKLLEDFR